MARSFLFCYCFFSSSLTSIVNPFQHPQSCCQRTGIRGIARSADLSSKRLTDFTSWKVRVSRSRPYR